jgi:hypothetical protein
MTSGHQIDVHVRRAPPQAEGHNASSKPRGGSCWSRFRVNNGSVTFRYSYEYLGCTPERWDRHSVAECCLEILPRKITAESAFFQAISPVLAAFFTGLAEKALLPNAGALAKTVAALDKEIIAEAEDPSNWGPAKGFMMNAMAAGVDMNDQAALHSYMLTKWPNAWRSARHLPLRRPFPLCRLRPRHFAEQNSRLAAIILALAAVAGSSRSAAAHSPAPAVGG